MEYNKEIDVTDVYVRWTRCDSGLNDNQKFVAIRLNSKTRMVYHFFSKVMAKMKKRKSFFLFYFILLKREKRVLRHQVEWTACCYPVTSKPNRKRWERKKEKKKKMKKIMGPSRNANRCCNSTKRPPWSFWLRCMPKNREAGWLRLIIYV